MKDSSTYGPQLDGTDGTLGELKLVKRWVIVEPNLEIIALQKKHPELKSYGLVEVSVWHGRNGHQNKATKAEAEELLQSFISNNRPELIPEGLKVAQVWCYPGHFDMACFCE